MMKQVIVSWSGGKDSCLACYKAMTAGYEVSYLANTISRDYRRVRFHGVEAKVIQDQARTIGIPLRQAETGVATYESEYKANIKSVLSSGIQGLVLGDIHLQACLTWANKVCKSLGVEAIEPLWGLQPEKVFLDFIAAGFAAVVVSTQANVLGEEWIGRKLDEAFLNDLKQRGDVDICGENGEYHTLVIDGPIFRQKIDIKKSQKVLREGYWFLDIQDYQLASKI